MATTDFIQDLAVVLVAVGITSALFTRLGWPKVIGYILAGTLIGEHTLGSSLLLNPPSIDALGQLGVLFLMFTLGLEFSLRKLKKVGHVIFPTAVLDMVLMVWAGHFVGTKIFGWGSLQSLFLGAAISDSATTLLAKTINDMGWTSRRFTKYIFGITITEDILCVGLIALLTGLVHSGTVQVSAMLHSLGGLTLFLTGVTVFGLVMVPSILNRVANLKDDESLVLTMLGICFLVAFIAAKLDFNLALGAFLVGVMGAESKPLKRIYQQFAPLRIMFSAIFFVTIGLLINPTEMLVNWKAILCVTSVVIVGKTINCTLGALLTGLDLKSALQIGIGLAQIGEFAYLVALIGVTMGAVDSNMYQIAVGVSVLSTILNPFLLRASDPFADWVNRKLPQSWLAGLETYAHWTERFLHSDNTSPNTKLVRKNFLFLILQMALIAVVFITAAMLEKVNFSGFSPLIESHKNIFLWGGAILLAIPNSIFVVYRARSLGSAVASVLIPNKLEETPWGQSFRNFSRLSFVILCTSLLFIEIALLSGTIMPHQWWARAIIITAFIAIGLLGWKRFRRLGIESLSTLRTVLTKEVETDLNDSAADILDIHTEKITVSPLSEVCGKSLHELNIRARFGASIIGIERQSATIVNPTAAECLQAGDTLLVLGDDRQISKIKRLLL